MRKLTHFILLVSLLLTTPLMAQTLSPEAQLSLLYCSPGKELYYHYGHAALRVQDPAYTDAYGEVAPIDWTFNYGIFDFNTDHFYWKFVKGETDYMLGLEYTSTFIRSAARADREVSYQPLILTDEQKQAIFDALLINNLPENRFYRYNFVYDNCATRPWHIVRQTLGIEKNNEPSGRTWRDNTDYFSGRWSWGKFGINLVFGYEADQEMTREQSLFLPENLMYYVSGLGLAENEDIKPFTPRDGNFWTSPELLIIVLLIVLLGVTFWDCHRKKQLWGLDLTLYIVYFVLGIIVAMLYFFSTHPFVGSNMNVLCINPLWLIPIVLCCFKRGRQWMLKASPWLLGLAVVAIGITLIKGQSLHLMLLLVVSHLARLVRLKRTLEAPAEPAAI